MKCDISLCESVAISRICTCFFRGVEPVAENLPSRLDFQGDLGGKSVSGATYSLNKSIMFLHAQCFSKAANVDIHGSLFDVDIATPDMIEQLATSIDPFLVG